MAPLSSMESRSLKQATPVSLPAATRMPFFDKTCTNSVSKLVFPLAIDVPDTITTGGIDIPARLDIFWIALSRMFGIRPSMMGMPRTSQASGPSGSGWDEADEPITPPRFSMANWSPTATLAGTLPTNPRSARRHPRAPTTTSSPNIRIMRPSASSSSCLARPSGTTRTTIAFPETESRSEVIETVRGKRMRLTTDAILSN